MVTQLAAPQVRSLWWAATRLLEPDLGEVESGEGDLARAWATFLFAIEATQYRGVEEGEQEVQPQNPLMIGVQGSPSDLPQTDPVFRDAISRYYSQGSVWRDGLTKAGQIMVCSSFTRRQWLRAHAHLS